ncbi:MAG: DUF4276 family protein [Spirochaetia bacterium]|nr:DUF4276 family protein [Spirochaetia bacterium]
MVEFGNISSLKNAKIYAHNNPELINDGATTHPSMRILNAIPIFNKIIDGVSILRNIGVTQIASECRKFNDWLIKIQ